MYAPLHTDACTGNRRGAPVAQFRVAGQPALFHVSLETTSQLDAQGPPDRGTGSATGMKPEAVRLAWLAAADEDGCPSSETSLGLVARIEAPGSGDLGDGAGDLEVRAGAGPVDLLEDASIAVEALELPDAPPLLLVHVVREERFDRTRVDTVPVLVSGTELIAGDPVTSRLDTAGQPAYLGTFSLAQEGEGQPPTLVLQREGRGRFPRLVRMTMDARQAYRFAGASSPADEQNSPSAGSHASGSGTKADPVAGCGDRQYLEQELLPGLCRAGAVGVASGREVIVSSPEYQLETYALRCGQGDEAVVRTVFVNPLACR